MIEFEEWLDMKAWYKRGMSISEIARRTGLDRKTVRKYLKGDGNPPRYNRHKMRPSILDPFKGYIDENVDDLNAARIFEDIKKMGYKGKYTIVKDYARTVKIDKGVKAVIRYETGPGVQMQVDWAHRDTVEIDGGVRKLYAFVAVLGFSRTKYVEYTLDMRTETFIQCHLNAFSYFGGYTARILYDNTKNVVLERALKTSDSKWNPLFKDFFTHFEFKPDLCHPGRPATKGKVENVIKYEEGAFFKGLEFESLQKHNGRAMGWARKVDRKPHGTTGIPPLELLEKERKHLLLVCNKPPYQIVQKTSRHISNDCFISYLGNKYSVPYQHAGRKARLLIHDGKFEVEVAGTIVCVHEIRAGSNHRIKMKEHFKGLYKEVRSQNKARHEKRIVKQTKLRIVPEVEERPLAVYDEFCTIGGE